MYNSHGYVKAFSVAILCLTTGTDAQLYQWSCSSLDAANNRYTLPDLGISDDEDVARIGTNLVDSEGSEFYIFEIPPALNCNGTVSALQYCYLGNINFGREQLVFTLLLLKQDRLNFTVTDTIAAISTPSSQICTRRNIFLFTLQYCCDTLLLGEEQKFSLPTSNFAFGTRFAEFLLTYIPSLNPHFLVENFRLAGEDLPLFTAGDRFTVNEEDRRRDGALQLLQFLITNDNGVPVTGISPMSIEPGTAPPSDDAKPGTAVSSVTQVSTPPGGTEHKLFIIVGVAVGGGVALLVIITCVVMMVVKFKSSRTTKQEAPADTNRNEVTTNNTVMPSSNQVDGMRTTQEEGHFYDYPDQVLQEAELDTRINGADIDRIMASSNQAYGINYRARQCEAARHRNQADGLCTSIVVSTNHAYGASAGEDMVREEQGEVATHLNKAYGLCAITDQV